MAQVKSRRRRGEWRRLVRAQEESGLTHAEFCRLHGVSIHAFREWKYGCLGLVGDRALTRGTKQRTRRPHFIAVHLQRDRATSPPLVPNSAAHEEGTPIEIIVPRGYTIRVSAGFRAEDLARLLAVIEAPRC